MSAEDDPSRMLRNGLAVVSFAALEDFMRARTREALSVVAVAGVGFGYLPKKLQQAATEGALRAALSQLGFMEDKATRGMPFVQDVASAVASTTRPRYTLSRYSLGHQGSNLTLDDVSQILKAFRVDKPWDQLTDLAARAGFSALPLSDFYAQVTRRRHKAAHEGSTDIQLADVRDLVIGARSCALAFEVVLARAAWRIATRQTGATRSSDIDLVFLDRSARGRRLSSESGATLLSAPNSSSISRSLDAAAAAGASLVARDPAGLPRAWYPHRW